MLVSRDENGNQLTTNALVHLQLASQVAPPQNKQQHSSLVAQTTAKGPAPDLIGSLHGVAVVVPLGRPIQQAAADRLMQ